MKPAEADARPILVIGYGNTLRGDDGAGPKVAEEIESRQLPGVCTLSLGLLTPEIADAVSRARRVIFVDASPECGTVQLTPAGAADSSQVMAHAADPGTILALARDLFGRAPEAFVVAIPAKDFSPGEKFSELTQRGIQTAIEKVVGIVQ